MNTEKEKSNIITRGMVGEGLIQELQGNKNEKYKCYLSNFFKTTVNLCIVYV